MKGVGRLDIQPYLHHIGINPERVSDRKALFRDIQRRHLLTVPFENLDIHLKHPLSMDPVKVQEKVAVHKRGGLCFELNSLLGAVYRELGYQVHYVSAAFWNEDKHDWNPPYSHLALNVNVEGKTYLADVGVGGGFMEPIEIRHGMVYEDHLATYRLEQTGDTSYILQKSANDQWEKLFQFSTQPEELAAFQPMCRYYETSKDTLFGQERLCSIATADGRISLSEESLTITRNKVKEKSPVTSEKEWRRLLKKYFGIDYDLLEGKVKLNHK
ncbi:N-hydroxyarylamine O-acetyltransferase [Melghiribacillus thermohalophilus]|uniref:N-hydroxyarylamine O-acetyltransferase n=1 Tax=Melghiribacillus thermohalophilus TaxID=1324956 RepID=A0A4R3N6Z1_9BACI|nr:N-hydroxyarylamine O-acetyltransferase [Melghiribacillus thermohalophilus]